MNLQMIVVNGQYSKLIKNGSVFVNIRGDKLVSLVKQWACKL